MPCKPEAEFYQKGIQKTACGIKLKKTSDVFRHVMTVALLLKNLQDFFQFQAHLPDDLLALIVIILGDFTRQTLTRSTYGETLIIK